MNENELEKQVISDYLTYLKVQKNYSQNTIDAYRRDIESFLNFLHQDNISLLSADSTIIRNYMENQRLNNISKVTLKRRIVALRGLYQKLVDKEMIHTNPFLHVPTLKTDKNLPHFLSQHEIDTLFELNKKRKDPFMSRDQALLELLFDTGMRVSEVCSLKITDIDLKHRHIRVFGKGRKERMVTFTYSCQKALTNYINGYRKEQVLNRDPKCLDTQVFLNKDGKHLTSRGIEYILDSIQRHLNLGVDLYPHKFRHTFATTMLNNGDNLIDIQHLMGHESINTTQIYTHITSKKKIDDYNKYFPRATKKDE